MTSSAGFAFDTKVVQNGSYAVTVGTQPGGQVCTVNNGSGTNVTKNITNVAVVCSSDMYSISGTVTGLLPGEKATLLNNGANPTMVTSNAGFSFTVAVAYGGNFAVTVDTQPVVQTCAVTNAGGTAISGNVTNVNIACGAANFSVLHSFTQTEAQSISAGLTQGSDGNLYGNSSSGGAGFPGTIFKYNPTTSGVTVVDEFSSSAGSNPTDALIQATDGNFYGTTYQSGTNNNGTIFVYNPTSGSLSALYNFNSATDGGFPGSGVTQGTDGNLYGVTYAGGANSDGTLYMYNLTTSTYHVLHTFVTAEGSALVCNLVQGADGNFYGVAGSGGSTGFGTLFMYNPGTTALTVLHTFANTDTDGGDPVGSLTLGQDGNFYGVTTEGGNYQNGVIFMYNPTTGAFSILHSFSYSDGIFAVSAGLIQGTDGNLYGVSSYGVSPTDVENLYGTVFMYTPSNDTLTVLHSFSGSDGSSPASSLIQATNGIIYGVTGSGGANGNGVLFQLH